MEAAGGRGGVRREGRVKGGGGGWFSSKFSVVEEVEVAAVVEVVEVVNSSFL